MYRMIALFALLIGSLNLFVTEKSHADMDFDQARVLTHQRFVEQALAKDPAFMITLQRYLQAKYAELSSKEISDWTLSAYAEFNHYEATSTAVSAAPANDSINYEISLQKLFLTSGTKVSIAHSNNLAESASSGLSSLTTQSSRPNMSLSVMQPLLKNAFGLSDRYPLIVADLQKKSAYADALEAWEGRIVDLEKAYLSWCNAFENVNAYRAIIKELTKLVKSVNRKFKSGVSDEKDLVQAEESLLQYQSLLIQAETNYVNETLNILYLQAGRVIAETQVMAIKPEQRSKSFGPIAPLELKEIRSLRLIQTLGYLKEQQLYDKKIADNFSLPSLDLIGAYTLKGEVSSSNGGYEAISDHNDYSVLLQASMPLSNYQARGDKGQAHAALNEINASIVNTERSMSLAIKQLASTINMTEQVLAIQKKLVSKSERKLALDIRNYNIGRLDIYYLIDTQNKLTNARLNLIKTKIQLDQLKLDYLAMTDQLLNKYAELKKQLQP